ncbi:MAG TPA: hypothetical protein VFW40_10075 [Capsulimonadaceae bacterium]|nr:hypothetical protein [Capsulimonadaceae bacterium]
MVNRVVVVLSCGILALLIGVVPPIAARLPANNQSDQSPWTNKAPETSDLPPGTARRPPEGPWKRELPAPYSPVRHPPEAQKPAGKSTHGFERGFPGGWRGNSRRQPSLPLLGGSQEPATEVVAIRFQDGEDSGEGIISPQPGCGFIVQSTHVETHLPSNQKVAISYEVRKPLEDPTGWNEQPIATTPPSSIEPNEDVTVRALRDNKRGSGEVIISFFGCLKR